ncbi:DsbA family protein [Candidatus Pacearchaeota archaeon]|nr:DsbA family protein [Candidatus Pacearchaeota archaeon]
MEEEKTEKETTKAKHHKTHKKDDTIEIPIGKYLNKLRENPWVISTFVLAIALIVFIIVGARGPGISVSDKEEVGNTLVSYINGNPALQSQVTLDSIEQEGQFYRVVVNYLGQSVPIYITLDGKYIVSGKPVPIEEAFASDGNNDDTENEFIENENVEVSEDDDAVLGNKNAKVTIIEFSDYQCPFCARFWSETLPLIKKEFIDTGKVKLVYRDFPLENIHPMARPAAIAAECVREKGGDSAYFKMHDKIFENQQDLSSDNLKKWATELGYNIAQCYDMQKYGDEVDEDAADAQAAGGTGTPYFVINGKSVSGALPFDVFKQIIDAELESAG